YMNQRYKSIVVFGAALVLAGCVTKKYERPTLNSNDLYRDVVQSDTATMADLSWKELFTDAALQRLIEQGLVGNLDLKQAIERINIAGATFRQSRSAFLPSLSADVS